MNKARPSKVESDGRGGAALSSGSVKRQAIKSVRSLARDGRERWVGEVPDKYMGGPLDPPLPPGETPASRL